MKWRKLHIELNWENGDYNRDLGYIDFKRIFRYPSEDVEYAIRYNSLDSEIFCQIYKSRHISKYIIMTQD